MYPKSWTGLCIMLSDLTDWADSWRAPAGLGEDLEAVAAASPAAWVCQLQLGLGLSHSQRLRCAITPKYILKEETLLQLPAR